MTNDYIFPEYIPDSVIQELLNFWAFRGEDYIRLWLENTRKQPSIGSYVEAQSMTIDGLPLLKGRWVPMWNNIGRVIIDNGSVKVSSTCNIRVISHE